MIRDPRHVIAFVIFLMAAACGEQGTLSVEQEGVDLTFDEPDETPDAPNDQSDGGDSSPNSLDPGEVEDDEGMSCPSGLDICSDVCVNLNQSDQNCGACGEACPTDTECASGTCACTDGGDLCDGACVDTTTSQQHCGSCGNTCSGGTACVSGNCVTLTEVEGVLTATNAARAAGQDCGQYGMYEPAPPLEADQFLAEAAQVHAVDMATNDFFSHTGSDGSSFGERVRRTDYSGFPMGENIAGGGGQAAGVVDRWVESDGHCRNLMNPQATKLGVGFAEGGPYGTMWVQVFGR